MAGTVVGVRFLTEREGAEDSARRAGDAAPFSGPIMKLMIRTRAALVAALLTTGIAFAAGEGWTSDFEAAKKEAAASKKSLLIDFTGSDWCGVCIELDKEVFSQDIFKNGVKDKFVLVELDFPQDKSKLSEATQKQNEQLAEKFAIEGYPTIFLADEEGRPFAMTGYQPGGPAAYVKHLDELLGKRKVRDEGLAAAEKAEGVAKAKALVSVLDTMGLNDVLLSNFYPGISDQIKKADPSDETGYGKKLAARELLVKIEKDVNELAQKQDLPGALGVVDKALKEGGLEPEDTQKVTLLKGMILAEQGKFDDAIKTVEESKKIAPESEMAPQIDQIKTQLEAMKAHGGVGE